VQAAEAVATAEPILLSQLPLFFAAAGAAAAPAPMLLGSDENVMPVSAFELRDLATLPALPWHAHSSLPPYQQPAARPGGCVMATPCCIS